MLHLNFKGTPNISTGVDTFDFDSAYLKTYLKEDEVVYLEQPVGYKTKDCRVWVWKLLKTLYELKQGARN